MSRSADTRIVIIGGGAAGLLTGYYLKLQGYRKVRIIEKEGRVGGMCRTVTHDYSSFDLGANYVTPFYREVRKLAREVGAKFITGPKTRVFDVKGGKLHSLLWLLHDDGIFAVMSASIRYLLLLFKYRAVLSRPGFDGIARYPELSLPFMQWLKQHNLLAISDIFIPPVTIFGYGALDQIPTAYVLKYMNALDFITALYMGLGFPGWPKRFKEGYQRFLERIAWGLDVHLNVEVRKVTRGKTIKVETNRGEFEFDEMIVACPLDQTLPFMDWTDAMKALIAKIRYSDYCVTAWTRSSVPHCTILEFPYRPKGEPWGISKMFPESDLCLFYTQLTEDMTRGKTPGEVERLVTAKINEEVNQLRKDLHKLPGTFYDDPYLFVRHYKYFPHVDSSTMAAGFYDQIEALQGSDRTYFTGGLFSFELVETIARYSKNLVNTNFPRV